MMRMLFALLALGGVAGVPNAAHEIKVSQTVSLSSDFLVALGGKFDALESAVVDGIDSVKRAEVTVSGADGHRRVQTGSGVTVSYYIDCDVGLSRTCTNVYNQLNDPATQAAHASAIVNAMAAVASESGFATGVLSSAADVVAAISVPNFVDISLGR